MFRRANARLKLLWAVIFWMGTGTATPALAQTQSSQILSDSVQPGEYIVQPTDVLRITIWPDSALGGEFPIEETGLVHLPVLGGVQVAGMSLPMLRQRLRESYALTIRDPIVSITPLFNVSVLGAVQRPGLYRVDPATSLFDVISRAGGLRPDAKSDHLRLIRGGAVLEINAERALETGEALLASRLQSGDRIVVPRRSKLLTAQNIFFILQSAVVTISLIQLLSR